LLGNGVTTQSHVVARLSNRYPGQGGVVRCLMTNMTVPRKVLVSASLIAALAAAAVTPMVTTANGDSRPHRPVPPKLVWSDCGDGVQCATAEVPLDYDHPNGRQISLALARVPATDPTNRIGSVFVNDGGPGNSVVDFVRGDARNVLPADVQARFDIVGFDPRGVGQSTPVRCFADSAEQADFFDPLPPFPVTNEEISQVAAASKELGRRCDERNGDLLDHLSTANVARDMDLLRRAVGDQQLTYAGYSYGGLLGMTYAKLYPDKVRALMLDGAPDPVAWTTGTKADRRHPFSLRVGSAQATSDAMGFFLDSCQEAGDRCAFASDDTRAKFDDLMATLVTGPITVDLPAGPIGPGGPTTLTYAFIVDGLRGGLQFPPIWADLAVLLQATYEASVATPTTPVVAAVPASPPVAEPDDGYDNSHEALLAVACSETDNPDDLRRWTKDAATADDDTPYFGADWTWLSLPCATWPAHDSDRSTGPFDRRTANPVLFVNARFDAASPYDRAVNVASNLPGARLLTLEGAAHPASFVPDTCLTEAIGRYLVEQELPLKGAVCETDTPPFT
jgi:pimeloyl-ACP methyl ester carboxylesterase